MAFWLIRIIVLIISVFPLESMGAWYDDGSYPTNMSAVCENLGSSCFVSELFEGGMINPNEGQPPPNDDSWFRPVDTMSKRCVTSSSVDPNRMYKVSYFIQESNPSTDSPSFSLPINHTSVWARQTPSSAAYMLCDQSFQDAADIQSAKRLCFSTYYRINNLAADPGNLCGGRRFYLAWGSTNVYLDTNANRIVTYNFDIDKDGTVDGYNYINGTKYGNFDFFTDCVSSWCRLEICLESDTASNLKLGKNLYIEGLIEKIGTSADTARYEYVRPSSSWNSDPSSSGLSSFRVVAFYRNGSCTSGSRIYFANTTVAGWTTSSGQVIGPTPEIGRGYTGYCDSNGLNCTGDSSGGGGPSSPHNIKAPIGRVILSKIIPNWDLIYVE